MTTLNDLTEVFDVLYQSFVQLKKRNQRTLFLTVAQIEQASVQLGLPLPADLSGALSVGVKRGAYLRCVTAETQYTGDKVLLYSYNPDMLLVNGGNAAIIVAPGCFNALNQFKVRGAHTLQSNARFPVSGYSGEIYGLGSGPDTGCTPQPLSDATIGRLQKCCKK